VVTVDGGLTGVAAMRSQRLLSLLLVLQSRGAAVRRAVLEAARRTTALYEE
jgi:hypothetical protein